MISASANSDSHLHRLAKLPTLVVQRSLSAKKEHKHKETLLIRTITAVFRKWGYFVADHIILLIALSLLMSALCAIIVFRTPYKNDLLGFVPYGAPSRYEIDVKNEFEDSRGRGILILIMLKPKDEGNAMRPEILKEAIEIDNIVMNNITIRNRKSGRLQTYSDICTHYCVLDEPMKIFVNAYLLQLELLKEDGRPNENLILNYPVMSVYGRKLNIQLYFGGVKLSDDVPLVDALDDTTNLTTFTNIRSAKIISLVYRTELVEGLTEAEVTKYELDVVDYFQTEYETKHVIPYVVDISFIDREITRGGFSMIPYVTVGFSIMAFCSTLSTLLSAAYMQQISFHKIYLAVLACICPLLANITALGLLLLMGVRYSPILCITPFLVLAIGVDDSYLMIHSWQRIVKECRRHPKKEDSVGYRLAEVLSETSPAVLISALTNILADAVGAFTSSPEITILCYGNMASIFIDFIYQLTFYSAIMCIAGRFEWKEELTSSNTHKIEVDNEKDCSGFCVQAPNELHDNLKGVCTRFLHCYTKLLTNGIFAFIVFVLWILYLVYSAIGISRIQIELDAQKLFPADSPLIEADRLRVMYNVPQFTIGQFYVNTPGNLSDPIRMSQLYNLVNDLEHLPGSWGPVGSNFFMREFGSFEKHVEDPMSTSNISESSITYRDEDLKLFLEWPEYDHWNLFIRLDEKSGTLSKFMFTTAYHGDNLQDIAERGILLYRWRKTLEKYRDDLNISAFHDDAHFIDLIENMPTDTWQSVLGTLVCMAVICFIFLYDTFTVVVVSLAILSIMTGIIGNASWMGLALEPIMMSAMLISMGFSIDIPAHVSYHYNSADAHHEGPITVEERLRFCLAAVGLPALQAASSTMLCLTGLLLVPLYMAQVFVKMMASCITLCLIHGLLIMPCIFSLIDTLMRKCQRLTSKVCSVEEVRR